MRQFNKTTNGSDLGRREQNRQAQHAFRQRRKAAEKAQRHRIQQLENSVEEISNILVGVCDEIIGTEELTKQPRLIARLHVSIARALTLSKSVSTTVDDSETLETGDRHGNEREETRISVRRPGRRFTGSPFPELSPPECSSSARNINGDASCTFPIDARNSLQSEMSSELVGTLTLAKSPWRETPQLGSIHAPFSLRLVKVTLCHACLYLNGDVYLPKEDLERAFGSSLRARTRTELLVYLRWLLGPGNIELHKATGTDWNTIDARGTGVNSQPSFLTAVAVQDQLERLGAKDLAPDIIELKINGQEILDCASADPGHALDNQHAMNNSRQSTSPNLIIHLNTSNLAANLACVAVCLEKGPVYPRLALQRAVEASVVLARDL